ncbi:hypothetical protein GNF65_15590, partial [Clostridium perfringens]|uniref:hypothetical protein n=1 Tax=Clostridium perfringens TaxID=1502 RepID=UPI002AC4A191
MITITRKADSLLVVLAVIITGLLPRAAEAAKIDSYSISSMDMTDAADPTSLAQSAIAPATIQNYPMPSIYTA